MGAHPVTATRRCTMCQEVKALDLAHFYKHPECKGGLDSACRSCRNHQRNEWRRRNSERLAARRREIYAAENGAGWKALEVARRERRPFRVASQNLANGLRNRGKERGLEVAPEFRSRAYVEAWLRRQPACECCGVEFHLGPKGGVKADASPSFDRFDLSEHYTLTNTALICWRCNNIKRNYQEADLRRVADWMERRRTTWGDEADKFGGEA